MRLPGAASSTGSAFPRVAAGLRWRVVFVVAVADFRLPVEEDIAALAADMGATAYDARLLVAAGTPAIVRTTPDKALALEVLGRLRGRGHGAVACDASAVVAAGDMVAMRRPRLEADAIALDDGQGHRLPYDDMLALVPAVHRRRVDAATQTRETKISVGRAVMTGGMTFTKTVKTNTHNATEERDGVLYVFRRSGARPWILREHGTGWGAMGLTLAPSESENYRLAGIALRARAPGATFDDRLMKRKSGERSALSGGGGNTTVKTSSEGGVDLLAHLLAMWIARGAYR
jgi:hypothetical protein